MDVGLISVLGCLFVLCETVIATGKPVETFEKFYVADVTYVPRSGVPHQHGPVGVSTVAKFSMLSHTPTLFRVRRPGLRNDPNTVSFESIKKPGHYLRYKNYMFHMEKQQDSSLFAKDATFRERQGPRGRAYELLDRDSWFMCHSEMNPFTLQAKSEKIGTRSFVSNCVYVPIRQRVVDKKNIVKTTPSGHATVVSAVPRTMITDKCIDLRFVNKLGGPVRVVSSMKPEGYLVTANVFKLKTIFKHANHKQRHIIFYADNIQDRDDDVLLNSKNVFTIVPKECGDTFKNVVLTSLANMDKKDLQSDTNDEKFKPKTPNEPKGADMISPQPAPSSPPVSLLGYDAPHPDAETRVPPGTKPTHSATTQATVTPKVKHEKPTLDRGIINNYPLHPITEAHEIGVPGAKEVDSYHTPASAKDSSHKRIKSLDSILLKRVGVSTEAALARQGTSTAPAGADQTAGYEAWSSYSACSATCGVGFRRRTRACRPGMYCSGAAAETRACIMGQCASNCIHTSGGNVAPGSCCSFPFTFNGVQYSNCILSPRNNERMWCSTTPYFDQDRKWGLCPKYVKAPARSSITAAHPPSPPVVQNRYPQQQTQVQPRQYTPAAQQQQQVQRPYTANTMATYATSPYNQQLSWYNQAYKQSNVPCSPMCVRTCALECPKRCCQRSRSDVPYTAYFGVNYGPTDKRSTIVSTNQPRYARNAIEELFEDEEY